MPDALENQKSQDILTIIERRACKSFLEVGIGPAVKFPQHEYFTEKGVAYTGVDFSHVCAKHMFALSQKGMMTPKHRFIGNDKGSPNFNLISLLDAGESFDLVYFDLHHTLNVDAVPAVLSMLLVKEGSGLIAFDDVRWKLDEHPKLRTDPFYSSMYNFDEYTDEQRRMAHVGVIIQSILSRLFDMEEDDTIPQRPGWKVYRKGGKLSGFQN
jgi:hypothetical protein